jgi:hypothetical protein
MRRNRHFLSLGSYNYRHTEGIGTPLVLGYYCFALTASHSTVVGAYPYPIYMGVSILRIQFST